VVGPTCLYNAGLYMAVPHTSLHIYVALVGRRHHIQLIANHIRSSVPSKSHSLETTKQRTCHTHTSILSPSYIAIYVDSISPPTNLPNTCVFTIKLSYLDIHYNIQSQLAFQRCTPHTLHCVYIYPTPNTRPPAPGASPHTPPRHYTWESVTACSV